jgi:hypothetical protein
MRMRLLTTVLAGMVMSACAASAGGGPSPSTSPTSTRPASTASIALVQPKANAIVTTSTVHVQFNLTGGRIVAVTTKNITPDTGHIHLFIDGRLISMNYQLVQDVSMAPFAAGPHILEGEFVAADHLPFNPPVTTKVIIEYQPSAGA